MNELHDVIVGDDVLTSILLRVNLAAGLELFLTISGFNKAKIFKKCYLNLTSLK